MKNKIPFKIVAQKYDLSVHKSWDCELIDETNDYYLFKGVFDKEINHSELGKILSGTVSFEYYYKSEFYNIFVFFEPTGEFRNFYCNINMPPVVENDVLTYIDLDIDILVCQDFSVRILDEKEFSENASEFSYPDSLLKKVKITLRTLLKKIETREFPFDGNYKIYQNL